jgi:hypothetical protein
MANYKIGTMLIASDDVELKDFLGNKTLVKKGTKIWIGADGLAHYQDGTIQSLPENSTVKGCDAKGITEKILLQLKADLSFDEMRDKYEIDFGVIRDSIEYALDELGIC